MLGVTSALAAEFATGVGVKQQVLEAPFSILASFIVIALASYIPIARCGKPFGLHLSGLRSQHRAWQADCWLSQRHLQGVHQERAL